MWHRHSCLCSPFNLHPFTLHSSSIILKKLMNVLVNTPDVVGERMAGPGIRAWHLAGELSKHFATTLVCKREGELPEPPAFDVATHGSAEGAEALREGEVLIGQPARGFKTQRRGQRIVYDLFDPVLLELREMYGRHPSMRQRIHFEAERLRVKRALSSGDLFIVATQKQRELYRGAAAPIIEIPFGVEDLGVAAPSARENIVLWGGGTWEWLDPATAVEAVVAANRRGISCRLLFLGRSRPNQHLADRRRDDRFDDLLAAGGAFVEANDSWTPYRDRLSWLRRSKIAIMLHRPTPEAAYSIRTRLFDAIAAAVPVITTEEGFAATLVAAEGLGIVVPPGNAAAVADAIEKLMTDDVFYARCVANLTTIQPRFAWAEVVRPLIEALTQWQRQQEN
jgi:glycosyltransferase involved in cell wall biosynthesis